MGVERNGLSIGRRGPPEQRGAPLTAAAKAGETDGELEAWEATGGEKSGDLRDAENGLMIHLEDRKDAEAAQLVQGK
ncbi:hypothetical protein Emed_002353 [Eimeria media]